MHKIITLYKFHKIHEPLKLQAALKKELKNLDILGTIIVGNEGINGTISGTSANPVSYTHLTLPTILRV